MIKKYLFIFCCASFVLLNEQDTIIKIRLGDKPFQTKIDNKSVIPNTRVEELYITDYDIKGIKFKSKNYVPKPVTENDIIIIDTNKGVMKFNFYNNEAPNHCNNFKKLANSNFYDGTLFHMLIPRFLVQGGDILSRDSDPDNDGTGSPGWIIKEEFNSNTHKRGILSMSRSRNDINSAGSQFFITLVDAPHLDSEYTVFGYLIEGDEVLRRIEKTTSDHDIAMRMSVLNIPENGNEEDWIEIINPLNNEVRYSKVPENFNKNTYKEEMQNRINNIYKPGSPIIIDSIRVIKKENEK